MNDNTKTALGHWIRLAIKFLIVAAIVAAVVYRVKFAPVAVHEHTVENGPIVAEVMGTGTLEARVSASISPKISGLISKVLVDQGDTVSAGDVLVELDDQELAQQVEIAHANLAAKQAAIKRLVTDKKRETAVLVQARKLLKRIEGAIGSGAVPQADRDKATESLRVAEAGLARAEAAIVEGQKDLITAQKNLSFQEAHLANAKIRAPFDGLIIRRQREPGDIVLPGSSILNLVSTKLLWVSAWVDETEMSHIHPDQPARVVFRSVPDHPFKGTVARLGRETDRETREFIVDVKVLETPRNWAVGQRAEVYIETGRKESAPIMPARYLRWHDNQPGVFVSSGNRVRWQPIKTGLRNEQTVEVVDGLQAGERIVIPVNPKTRLKEGAKVSPARS
jgi:RND family efflux transporter MFP subunit